MANIEINVAENGTTTLATAGKYCDRNIDVVVEVAGGGGADIPEEAYIFSGKCAYTFASDKWKWFLEPNLDKVQFTKITDASNMFDGSTYESLGNVEINFLDASSGMSSIFNNMASLKEANFKFTGNIKGNTIGLFSNCRSLKTVGNIFQDLDMSYFATQTSSQQQQMFYNCYSLREIDKHIWDNIVIARTASYGHLYSSLYQECNSLDEAYIPIYTAKTYNDNCFSNTVNYCNRLKNVLFATNEDGTPIVVNWKNQNFDLGASVGYASISGKNNILNYSGITADKEVKDDATYQALKNDADWFTTDMYYSRYNHDSAVNTINSLPDTSAYITANGGANTIKFRGLAGSYTDGGAINTLTEAEIAVAAAKGWTVTLS